MGFFAPKKSSSPSVKKASNSSVLMVKLVNGEIAIGTYDPQTDSISKAAALRSTPPQEKGGVQFFVVPFGVPFENTFSGVIEGKFFLYRYNTIPKELADKYIEMSTNEAIAKGALGGLHFSGNGNGGDEKKDDNQKEEPKIVN